MTHAKVAISIDRKTLNKLDILVEQKVFQNRSKAIQSAVAEKLKRIEKSRLARECAKLIPDEEKSIAEEGLSEDFTRWPETNIGFS